MEVLIEMVWWVLVIRGAVIEQRGEMEFCCDKCRSDNVDVNKDKQMYGELLWEMLK